MTEQPDTGTVCPTIDLIKQICVIGAGTAGAQVAQTAALAGYDVYLIDKNQAALERGIESNRHQLQLRVNKARLSAEQADQALARVRSFNSLEAAAEADFVIEATAYRLEARREIFQQLDKICPPHAILASNSSTIVISRLAGGIRRKDKACNMHFFHPALIMQLVEIVRGPDTSDETVEVAAELGRRMGKEVVVMQKELLGLLGPDTLRPDVNSVLRLYEGGYAGPASLEQSRKSGARHPLESITLAEAGEQEMTAFARLPKYRDSGDPRDKPPAFLEEMVRENRRNIFTGSGHYGFPK